MRAFPVRLPSGQRYWTVLDEDLQVVEVADGFLRHQRFGRDGAESTTKAYAHAIALFLRWCARTGRGWQAGVEQFGLFMVWLAHAGPAASGAEAADAGSAVVLAGPGAAPARCPSRINGVLTAVRGMVVHAVAAGQAPAGLVPLLYEVADDRDLPERRGARTVGWRWRMRARHRLREPETPVDRASDEEIVALLRACRSARDRLIVLVMARAGLRRGELCGLRRGDVHLLADSRGLGCEVARAHLHVVRRDDNPNGAWAKSRRQRVVPLDFLTVQAFDTYEFERMRVAAGRGQRLRVREPVPRPDRRADAPGRGRGAARGGLAPGWAGHRDPAAPAAARLRQQPRRCRRRHRRGRRPARTRLGVLLAGVRASRPVPTTRRGGRGAQSAGAGRGGPVNAAATVLVTAVSAGRRPPAGAPRTCSVTSGVLDAQAVRLAVLVDPRFLAECGWDSAGQVLAPPPDHPQLGWTPPVGPARAAANVAGCVVPGCSRPPGSHGLCRAHRSRQVLRGISVDEFAADPARRALARFGPCLVAACPRDRHGGRVAYCEPHQSRWTRDRRADPGLDEARWRRTTSPVVVTGQVSLAGMPPLITAQVLYGLQQRTRSGAHTRVQMLRMVVEDLRHAQADSVHADSARQAAARRWGGRSARVLTALARHAALALSDPETEKAKDVWELAVFGLAGRLSVHHHLAALAAAGGQAVGRRRAPAPPR